MSIWKRILLLASLFVLFLGALRLPFQTQLEERESVLASGWGDRTYLWAAAGENGLICAASRDGADRVVSRTPIPDGMELRFFNRRGDVQEDWTVPLPREALEGELCALYPADTKTAFLAFWQEDTWGGHALCLYRAVKGKDAEELMKESGTGETWADRRMSVQISSFTRNLDRVFFALLRADRVTAYSCPVAGGAVSKVEEQVRDDVLTAAVLPDGALAFSGTGFLTVPGRENSAVSANQTFSRLTCSVSGIYCVENHALTVWYSDLTGVSMQQLYPLDAVASGHRISSVTLTPDGDALALLDGHTLYLVQGGGVTNLNAALYPGWWNSLLAEVCWLLGAWILAFLLWQVLSIVCQNRIPLALYWGTVVLAAALSLGTALRYRVILPAGERAAAERRTELLSAVTDAALRERSISIAGAPQGVRPGDIGFAADGGAGSRAMGSGPGSAAYLARHIETLLDGSGAPDLRDLRIALARRDGQGWYMEDGTRAELDRAFHPALADRAERMRQTSAQDGERFWYSRASGDVVLTVSAVFVYGSGERITAELWRGVTAWCAAVTAVMLAVMLLVNVDVRRLAAGISRYASGEAWRTVRVRSGDELEGMAASLNALARGRAEEEEKRNELAASYRRFVPESVIALLGKKSILDVDQQSFAARRCAVMAISFTFPASVYADTRFLFESVNQVIERTASLAEKKGGTVFNFSYDSYDVVMEDAAQAVSAAVAMGQETLAFNERRVAEGLPPVILRSALDVGDVVIGIVGDGSHLEQTTVSPRLSAVRDLIRVGAKLEAGILCTEAAFAAASGYGSRYMGKCRTGGDAVRIYEIFDADPYQARTEKASTLRRFTQSLLDLYSGNLAEAKRDFLKLAHETPDDGGARYYLYLADQLERNPDLSCELDADD